MDNKFFYFKHFFAGFNCQFSINVCDIICVIYKIVETSHFLPDAIVGVEGAVGDAPEPLPRHPPHGGCDCEAIVEALARNPRVRE
jgi:hypothetical protein